MSAPAEWPYGGRPYLGASCDCCERSDVLVVSFNDDDGATLCEECCEALSAVSGVER